MVLRIIQPEVLDERGKWIKSLKLSGTIFITIEAGEKGFQQSIK